VTDEHYDDPEAAAAEAALKLASETTARYEKYRMFRQPHEGTWFVNAAMLRGQQKADYDADAATLVMPEAPSYAVSVELNKIRPKHRARMAKFFKNRPKPVVIPASTDYKDLMDARATERAIRYQWDRLRLESAYHDVRLWASVGSKAYWWLGYNENTLGRVELTDPITGRKRITPGVVGDITLEVGNVWEVLVADPTIAHIGKQPEILRVRAIQRKDAETRFPQIKAEQATGGRVADAKQTEDKLAGLKAGEHGMVSVGEHKDEVLLIERYVAPCGPYPKGRRIVVCAGILVDAADELPFEFYDSPTNPVPCVEFSDGDHPGQFWGTTFIEQLVPLQRMLNRVMELIVENAEAVSRPKIIVYKQHNLPDGAWTSAAGEVVELTYIQGLPEPRILQAANVSGDLWNIVNLLLRQFDDISQIHTASEGGGSGQESGYQTNLLQEATDAVHAPDIRRDELAIEDAAWKMRRIMKLTYDVPRLIAIGGENSGPEMLEFSNRQINDAAEVRIQIGSMLPDLKAAKAQIALEYYKGGLLGDPADPQVRRKALGMIDMAGYEVIHEEDKLDEDEASRENQALKTGVPVSAAKWFHNHAIHALKHEAYMKTPEFALLPDVQKLTFVAHLVTHYDFLNMPLAMGLRSQYGLQAVPIAAPPPPDVPPAMPGAPGAPGAPPPAGASAPAAPLTAPAPPPV
jgi:hypothetical protein